jgi:hypothetical protein
MAGQGELREGGTVTFILGIVAMLMMACVLYLSRGTGQRKRVDWLHIGELELNLFGHLTEETRQKVARLWATGDQVQRSRASALLDQESFMHAGHERLARIEELAAKIQMLDLKEKLAKNPPGPPPWPVPEWRH